MPEVKFCPTPPHVLPVSFQLHLCMGLITGSASVQNGPFLISRGKFCLRRSKSLSDRLGPRRQSYGGLPAKSTDLPVCAANGTRRSKLAAVVVKMCSRKSSLVPPARRPHAQGAGVRAKLLVRSQGTRGKDSRASCLSAALRKGLDTLRPCLRTRTQPSSQALLLGPDFCLLGLCST